MQSGMMWQFKTIITITVISLFLLPHALLLPTPPSISNSYCVREIFLVVKSKKNGKNLYTLIFLSLSTLKHSHMSPNLWFSYRKFGYQFYSYVAYKLTVNGEIIISIQ